MKKKNKTSANSEVEAFPGQPAADYVIGQVSGSLFTEGEQKKKKKKNNDESQSGAGSLSALFSINTPSNTALFTPAPKPVPKTTEEEKPAPPELPYEAPPKKKNRTQAEEKVDNRESSLQQADSEELKANTRRQRKRKTTEEERAAEQQKKKEVEEYVAKRQKVRNRRREEGLKDKRTAFVGNLPVDCTKKTLLNVFKEKGTVESIRFRSVVREDPAMSRKVAAIQRKVHPKKKSINAYVVFKEEEGVTAALEMNGMEIEKDYFVRVDRVTDTTHDHKRSVFVGNLSFEMSELRVRRHFDECGPLEAVRLIRDPSTGLGKGFGYLLFQNPDSVQLALEMDGSKLEGRPLRVKRSVHKERQSNTDAKSNTNPRGKNQVKGGGGFKKNSRNDRGPVRSGGAFRGEMTDPVKKKKKKKDKPRKRDIHI